MIFGLKELLHYRKHVSGFLSVPCAFGFTSFLLEAVLQVTLLHQIVDNIWREDSFCVFNVCDKLRFLYVSCQETKVQVDLNYFHI